MLVLAKRNGEIYHPRKVNNTPQGVGLCGEGWTDEYRVFKEEEAKGQGMRACQNCLRKKAIGECDIFHWIGQPFTSCDRCGDPYWEHTYRWGMGEQAFDKIEITEKEAQAVRRKWDPEFGKELTSS